MANSYGYGSCNSSSPEDLYTCELSSMTTDGNYWVEYTATGDAYDPSYADNVYYFSATRSGGVWSSTIPMNGVVSQTTPAPSATVGYIVNFTGTYNNSGLYNQICAFFTTTGESLAPYCSPIPSINGASLPYNFTYTLDPNHTYNYTLQLFDGINYSTATSPVSFSTLSLATTTEPAWTPEACDWTSPATYGGCIDNIFRALFYPSSASLTNFNNLYNMFINKPPFGYINAIINSLKGLNDTGTSVFSLQSLPILNTYIFTPIRTALAWILWVGFAFLLIKLLPSLQL
jgi:hypothetical protein